MLGDVCWGLFAAVLAEYLASLRYWWLLPLQAAGTVSTLSRAPWAGWCSHLSGVGMGVGVSQLTVASASGDCLSWMISTLSGDN